MKKTIVLGVTGGIAAFKAAQLTSNLIKKGYDVEVIITKNATEFIAPLTFESLTKHNVMVSTFEKVADRSVKHVSIAKRADIFVIVPATANVIAKIVHGLADDMLTTTFLAATCPKVICPAMNTNMYENPITQNNLKLCKEFGFEIIDSADGYLACGDSGKGKLQDIALIEERIEDILHESSELKGKHVLVSAGPTQEAMDPVRFISNHSSGKMGYAIARAAANMGAEVTLVSGPVSLSTPYGVNKISITSANEMSQAIKEHMEEADFIIKAAAVGDYRVEHISNEKIKKQGDILELTLHKNEDILAYIGAHKKPEQVLCGFAMETENLLENAEEKRKKKNCDMIVANNLKTEGAGFQGDTNVAVLLQENGTEELGLMSKYELGKTILLRMLEIQENRKGTSVSC